MQIITILLPVMAMKIEILYCNFQVEHDNRNMARRTPGASIQPDQLWYPPSLVENISAVRI